MQSVSCSDVRQRIIDQVVQTLGPDGWTHDDSGVPELFGRAPRPLLHLGFAVALPESPARAGERQRAYTGVDRQVTVTTAVQVKWSFRLTVSGKSGDYGAALDAENRLAAFVLATNPNPFLDLAYVRATRTPSGDGSYLTGTIEFSARHPYNLSTSPS